MAGPARGLAAGGLHPDAAEVEQHAARETSLMQENTETGPLEMSGQQRLLEY